MTEVASFPIGLRVKVVIGFETEMFSIVVLVWTLFSTSFLLFGMLPEFLLLLFCYKLYIKAISIRGNWLLAHF